MIIDRLRKDFPSQQCPGYCSLLLAAEEGVGISVDKKIDRLLTEPLVVVNLGLIKFAKSLEEQGVEVIQVDWVPPAGGDKEVMERLDELL